MKDEAYGNPFTVTGNFKANPERDGLELLDEEFGMVPVKLMFRRNPGLKANQIFALRWRFSRPVRLLFCIGAVLDGP